MIGGLDMHRRILSFKQDLVDLQPLDVIRKNIIYGHPAAIADPAYFALRSTVAAKYEIHPNEVLVVGSAKLGFSIAPSKRYRPFCDESDIDVVIVSDSLFSRIWRAVHDYENHGGYWERGREFKDYLFQGWIRPDKLPPSHSFEFGNDWWEFFNALSSSGDYSSVKIRGALYKDWYFLEAYQMRAVSGCADEIGKEKK
ncbi:MAG: hypothetical protein WC029_01845 [Sulfuricella sp.]|jgi:predicted nucleotidyltransferase